MGQSFYVYNDGDLKRKDNTLRFTSYEGEKRDIPIERIDDIYIMSEMSFNTTFLTYISQYGIPIHFFNYYNFYTGSFYPREQLLAGNMLVKQVEHYTDYTKRMVIAQKFIEAAADNIYRNLRYYNGRGKAVSQCKCVPLVANIDGNGRFNRYIVECKFYIMVPELNSVFRN